ncbi:MAG: energy transducer TonB [Gammaproteobacteria bacterium]|nr:energy transducer TonB [Sideroxydans sp.]MBU3903188.1 energy transducer TonB [Gammaproteobacteria bacterium]MBU4045263.1 energy transducer TonB [Gammaproteobacteria bacterium]MBU4151121.1 energy transducer TonB [Gammaproteobacteria bacterium]
MSALVLYLPLMHMDALRDTMLESPWYERLTVVGIVVLAHLSLFAFWLAQPQPPKVAVNEMSISFANMQMQQADVAPQPEVKPAPKREPRVIEPEAPQSSAEPVVEVSAPPTETPPSPVQLDAEPDYRADYLNNPRPPYPLVARRMGYQGKVVLNVEVLAEGRAGEVKLQTSSGYDILDRAALQTVKTWKFSPATRFGQPITQWFLVPIKFSLEE